MNHRIHISWLLAALSCGILIGTVASLYSLFFSSIEWFVFAGCIAIIAFLHKKTVYAVGLIFLAGLIIGLARGSNQLISQKGFELYLNQDVELSGRVSEDPSYDTDGDLRLRLVDVEIDNVVLGGEVWVVIQDEANIKRSDIVVVEGRLSKGFGNIPAAVFRARVTVIERQDYSDVARDTRDWFASGIRKGVHEPEASLGSGFLLGQKTALPEKLDNELRLLGLTHIVVASGYNLSILVRFGRRFFARISRFTGLAASGFLVLGFANVTGFSPSMTRASLITGLSLLAWYYGRKFHPIVLLTLSAAVTVLINPAYAWGDIGWLLSFTSFIGVIMFSPLIHAYFWGDKKPGNIRQVFIETLSAQILTLPLIAFVFGQYSPLALLANVLILPLIPIAMLLTFIAGLGGIAIPTLAEIIGTPAEVVMRYMTFTVDKLADQPLAASEIAISGTYLAVGYCFILVAMIFLWRRTGYEFREYNIIE